MLLLLWALMPPTIWSSAFLSSSMVTDLLYSALSIDTVSRPLLTGAWTSKRRLPQSGTTKEL